MRQEIRLLGEVQVFDGRRSHHPPVDKRLGLLGYLACKAGVWVEREKVAFLFWPDVDDGRARKNLRSLVARCRNLPFAGTLEADPHRLRWPIYSDVAALREALARGAWHEVIELYRGDLLGDATLEDSTEFNAWLDAERHEMRRSYRSAVLGWALERHAAGAGAEAVELLEDLLAHDPIDEEAAQVALSIVANVGRGEVAARLYRNLDLALQASVGVGPSEATKRLLAEASAAAGDHKRRAQPAGALRPPRPLTSFIGREADLARIADLLEDPECRLVSIVGPGGVGKTRLALRAAEVLGDRYEHGAPFVPLETVTDPQRVPAQVARALDLRLTAGPDAAGQVIEAIGDKRMLLVVDNIEQALAAVGFFERLLERCANVDVIMTTRERPGSTAEWLVPIQGLSVPPSDASPAAMATFDAVRLFVERARQVVPEFALDDDAARHVVRIADLTEGLPLALELAAVWLRVLSPEEVVTEIERNLGMLVSENRSGPSRHRSIRATFDHSWSQLSAREAGAETTLVLQWGVQARGGFQGRGRHHPAPGFSGRQVAPEGGPERKVRPASFAPAVPGGEARREPGRGHRYPGASRLLLRGPGGGVRTAGGHAQRGELEGPDHGGVPQPLRRHGMGRGGGRCRARPTPDRRPELVLGREGHRERAAGVAATDGRDPGVDRLAGVGPSASHGRLEIRATGGRRGWTGTLPRRVGRCRRDGGLQGVSRRARDVGRHRFLLRPLRGRDGRGR